MAKKIGFVLAVVVGLCYTGCTTQYNNLLQPTVAGQTGVEEYTILGAVSIVAVGAGPLSTPLQYADLLKKARSVYGERVSKVINVQINSYEYKLFGFISVSRETHMAGLAVQ